MHLILGTIVWLAAWSSRPVVVPAGECLALARVVRKVFVVSSQGWRAMPYVAQLALASNPASRRLAVSILRRLLKLNPEMSLPLKERVRAVVQQLLADRDDQVRLDAVHLIWRTRLAGVESQLVGMIGSSRDPLSFCAAGALLALGHPDKAREYATLTREECLHPQEGLLDSLRYIATREAVDALIDALKSDSPPNRLEAYDSLSTLVRGMPFYNPIDPPALRTLRLIRLRRWWMAHRRFLAIRPVEPIL